MAAETQRQEGLAQLEVAAGKLQEDNYLDSSAIVTEAQVK